MIRFNRFCRLTHTPSFTHSHPLSHLLTRTHSHSHHITHKDAKRSLSHDDDHKTQGVVVPILSRGEDDDDEEEWMLFFFFLQDDDEAEQN